MLCLCLQQYRSPTSSTIDAEAVPRRSVTTPLLGSSSSPDEADNAPRRAQRHFKGWRMGATLCAIAAATILLFNITLTIVASARNGDNSGLATIQEGSCSESEQLDLWLHLLINALSTGLLAASNYCMQCISAPTREDIDKAHAQRRWLDIGVPSIRNLRNIPRFRLLLWWLLALSSIPLHLLYNSTVIASRASQEYAVFVAAPDLLSGNGLNWSTPIGLFRSFQYYLSSPDPMATNLPPLDQFRDLSSWNRLSNDACIQAYFQSYIIGHGDVVAITSASNATVPMMLAREVTGFDTLGPISQEWMCSASDQPDCGITSLRAEASTWTLNDTVALSAGETYSAQYPVEYCLSQPVRERCTVELSLVIMAVVILCNVVKVSCMLLVLRQQRFAPLVTVGDTIESFMLDRDATTQNMCWANKKTFISQNWEPSAKPWLRQRHFWFASASVRRWVICNICSIAILIVASILYSLGIAELSAWPGVTLWNSGFGTVNMLTMANWSFGKAIGILPRALIANTPQLLLSFLFLTYNGLYTCMLLADEWNGYAHERKPLRVTDRHGSQRSTYRLQLPYKYSIPLIITSTIVHWLVSESLFLARVIVYTRTGQVDTNSSVSTVGYSCAPLLIVIILGSITVLLGLLNGFRRYKPGMPLAGSCSAAISAACHLPAKDIHASEKPVLWGVVGMNDDGVGHCSFTSLKATAPTEGERYAGS